MSEALNVSDLVIVDENGDRFIHIHTDYNEISDTCNKCHLSYFDDKKLCEKAYDTSGGCSFMYWIKEEESPPQQEQPTTKITFAESCEMTDFGTKMKSLTDELMLEYDIPARFNGTGKYPIHLTNIEAVVRQALWVGFLHGKKSI